MVNAAQVLADHPPVILQRSESATGCVQGAPEVGFRGEAPKRLAPMRRGLRDEDVLAIDHGQALGADGGRHDRHACCERFQDLEPCAPAGLQRLAAPRGNTAAGPTVR
jgi:hypothetical protein